MNTAVLKQHLTGSLVDINNQISVMSATATELGMNVHQLKNTDGTFALVPLLLARAQVLNGLATIDSPKPRPATRNSK